MPPPDWRVPSSHPRLTPVNQKEATSMSSNLEIQRIQAKYQELGGKPAFGDPAGPPKDLTRIVPQDPKPSGTDPRGHPVKDSGPVKTEVIGVDRKSTRLNSSH